MTRHSPISRGLRQTKTKIPAPPRLGATATQDSLGSGIETDGVYRAQRFEGSDLSGIDVDSVEIDQCRFEGAALAGSHIRQSMISDGLLDRCDLANLEAVDSSLIRVALSGSRLTGMSWTSGMLRDVCFDDCRAGLAAFRFSRFKTVLFKNCELVRANFQNADLTGARFERCDLTGSQFSNAQMQGARFEECALHDIVGVTSFSGASVKSADALGLAYSLASALGITIEE
jgi:uncharacterized protein YjbI with pentapeptide repeats